jgi:hypothetical protein
MPILAMDFVPVPEPKTVKNRIDWDITGSSVTALAGGRGAARAVRRHWLARPGRPRGTEFCAFTMGQRPPALTPATENLGG